jgi:hypothetical protein
MLWRNLLLESSGQKMEAAGYSETLMVPINQTTEVISQKSTFLNQKKDFLAVLKLR